jgi:hypothetical protein
MSMPDFNIRSDSVNVEQIMRQIQARIREKRGVDYTEQQIRELAAVKLERFLDPTKVRSELLQQFRQGGIAPLPNYAFEDTTLFDSHRAPLRLVRRLLRPFLKLLFNPQPLSHVLHLQADINDRQAQYSEMSYEILHNLVVEVTRLGIEVKNLKMRVESLSGRLDFSERRVRALEGVVQYRPGEIAEETPAAAAGQAGGPEGGGREARESGDQAQSGTGEARRRRRRRRGRRGGTGRPGTEDSTAQAVDAPDGDAADEGAETEPEAADDRGAGDAPVAGTEAPGAGDPDREGQ